MPRKIDPRRACLPLAAWPMGDRQAWEDAMRAARGRFSRRGHAARLAPDSIDRANEGYGRWLGFLRHQGWLDAEAAPLQRVTEERAAVYLDTLKVLGNSGYTIVGRFAELQTALRIMVRGAQVGWLTNPNGMPLRHQLAMEKRDIRVPHSAVLYAWGLETAASAVALSGARRRQVMLRDGVLIALLAAAGPRMRSVQLMRLGQHIRFDGEEWWLALDVPDIKNDKPHLY